MIKKASKTLAGLFIINLILITGFFDFVLEMNFLAGFNENKIGRKNKKLFKICIDGMSIP